MPEPTNPQAVKWPRQKRYEHALRAVLDRGWSQSEAAKYYGVDRKTLSGRCRKILDERIAAEKATDAAPSVAEQVVAEATKPLALQEERRLPGPVEFQELYFGHFPCPNHGVVHEMPQFHKEMAEFLQGGESGLINLPPGHAKTTVATVRDTIYDIVKNPNSRTILVSESLPFARKLMVPIEQMLINTDLYEGAARSLIEDWGPFKPEGTASIWNSQMIYVAGRSGIEKDPTVQVLGLRNQIYGARADKIKFDDIATLKNQTNPELVVEQLEWINKEAASRVGPDDPIFFIGTRIKPDDIYAQIFATWGDLKVVKYPCILDEEQQITLWPEHFSFDTAQKRRARMSPQDWELVYQQVEVPGVGMSFPRDVVEQCLDFERTIGHFERHWVLIAGLDPAGSGPESGYSAFTLWGLDRDTGMFYLVDCEHVSQMKAPAMKDFILGWSEQYPIAEWRVEGNGMQRSLVQYNEEVIKPLAAMGTRVSTHITGTNKHDAEFGVETMAPLFHNKMVSIPYAGQATQRRVDPLLSELCAFPLGSINDLVMSSWFAHLGLRERMRRVSLPMFREEKRWPSRIKRRRRIVDFQNRQVTRVSPGDQRRQFYDDQGKSRRLIEGLPGDFAEEPDAGPTQFVNVS